MSPPYRRTCARCGNYRFAIARFPDGHICETCLIRALRTRGIRPGCGNEQLLIGRLAGDVAACRQCAGITREFSCRHCGYEGEHCRARLCDRCGLAPRLDKILDDGTGRPCPALAPLAAALCTDPNLSRVLKWIKKPRTRAVLADLATGRTEITHAALAARPDRRTATYLRDLLVDCGVLPAADRQLLDDAPLRHQRRGRAGAAGGGLPHAAARPAAIAHHPPHHQRRHPPRWPGLPAARRAARARPRALRHDAHRTRRRPARRRLAVPRPLPRPAPALRDHAPAPPGPRAALRTAPAAALRELVLQVPAPVAATALGFHHTTTQRQRAAAAGGTWNRYAAPAATAKPPPLT